MTMNVLEQFKDFFRLAEGHHFSWVDFKADYRENRETEVSRMENANAISSMMRAFKRRPYKPGELTSWGAEPEPGDEKFVRVHKPVLDLDIDAALIPSSTEGHWHLMLDVEMETEAYFELLRALAKAGVIEENYADVCINRHNATWIRTPWTKKDPAEPLHHKVMPIWKVSGTDGTDVCDKPGCEQLATLADVGKDEDSDMFFYCQNHAPARL